MYSMSLFGEYAKLYKPLRHVSMLGVVMLSRDCDGCERQPECKRRFAQVSLGEKVFCPDGTAHLVDSK
jgi:hypothetical protein